MKDPVPFPITKLNGAEEFTINSNRKDGAHFWWFSFAKWSSSHGRILSLYRIYRNGKWTPFVRVYLRYANFPTFPF